MFWYSSVTVHKINNKSDAVKLSLTQADIDQDVLLTLPSHACRKLLFPSCQVVIRKALHWAAWKLKTWRMSGGRSCLFLIWRFLFFFDSIINLSLEKQDRKQTHAGSLKHNQDRSSFCHDEEVKD